MGVASTRDLGKLPVAFGAFRTSLCRQAGAPQQFLKIVLPEGLAGLLQALVVQHEVLHDELPQRARGPDAELGGADAIGTVAHGDNGVEVIALHEPLHVPRTFRLNYSEFPDSCLRGQFAFLEDPAQVFVHRAHILIEEFADLLLAQPKSLVLEVDFDAHLALGRGG